ncbi:MAG: hypothetical protein JO366_02130 [Methylobacteriaceae bacterium]|nr:hypothetical protein [Methylobacteriaceae bacterium]MBV9243591.1 hypothetical protein [Methylobacteriaceae bacterium]
MLPTIAFGVCIAVLVVGRGQPEGPSFPEIIGQAAAQDDSSLAVENFLLDWRTTIGRRVTISGCKIAGFLSDAVGCYPETGKGRVAIDRETLDRESLRRVLNACVGLSPPLTCRVTVSGLVESDPALPHLGDAVLTWRLDGAVR